MSAFLHDLKCGIRTLRQSRGFTAITILTLAFGIGATTAVFSVISSVLLHPIATPEVNRLAVVRQDLPNLNLRNTELAPAALPDLAGRTEIFENIAGFRPVGWNLTGLGEPVQMAGALTLGDFFETFRVRPHLGRLYGAAHSTTGDHSVVVLSHGAWQLLTGGDPSVIHRKIQLDGETVEVIGVLPADFRYPRPARIYRPFHFTPEWRRDRGRMVMTVVARLRPHVTWEQLDHQLGAEAARWNEQYARVPEMRSTLHAIPLTEYLAGRLQLVLAVLFAAVVFVLLIACANVASLQLVRTAARSRDVAVQIALGAGRGRIIRQFLVENTALALAGGALGLCLVVLLITVFIRWDAAQQHALDTVRVDGLVLAFTTIVSMLAALAFGTLPAVRAIRVQPLAVLRESSRGAAGSLGRSRLLHGSVVIQLALVIVLLVGSGLMIQSLARLLETDLGFRAERLTTAQVSLPANRYSTVPQQTAFYDTVLTRLRGMPGIEAATVGWALPFSDHVRDSSPFGIVGEPNQPGQPRRHAEYRIVDRDYFRTMGIPLLQGRTFDRSDDVQGPRVVLIDKQFATQFFSGGNPVGRQIQHALGTATIIGVVGSINQSEVGEPVKAVAYYHHRQTRSGVTAFAIRASLDPQAVPAMLRTAIAESDPQVPIFDVTTMEQRIQRSLSDRRLALVALSGFAGLSLLLALLGVYGLMRYTTALRTQEIGIRLALGASRGDVVGQILRQGMIMVAVGILVGVVAALQLTQLMTGILFGIRSYDPVTFVAVTVLLALAASVAIWLPARRAAHIEPAVTLRSN